jgi:hypothetical protein
MRLVLLLLSAILIFGCAGQTGPTEPAGPLQPSQPVVVPGEECTEDYSFSEIEGSTYGSDESLVATVTCAAGKTLTAKVNGNTVATETVEENSTTPVEFSVPALKEGTLKVTVEDENQTLYSRDWEVEMLGNSDLFGTGYESFSFKEWIAMAFDIDNEVELGQVKAYLKRQSSQTQPSSMIVLEVREDQSGVPGKIVASKKLPIADTTLSPNWLKFDLDEKATLRPGRYWIVLKIDQTEEISLVSDVVTVHYAVIDKDVTGNDYTGRMVLDVDLKTGYASETSWESLSYDREFNIMLGYGK